MVQLNVTGFEIYCGKKIVFGCCLANLSSFQMVNMLVNVNKKPPEYK